MARRKVLVEDKIRDLLDVDGDDDGIAYPGLDSEDEQPEQEILVEEFRVGEDGLLQRVEDLPPPR